MVIFERKELYTYIDKTGLTNEIKEELKEILGLVIRSEDNDINLDFDDLKNIMNHVGIIFGGIGEYDGKKSATKAIELAIKNSSFDYSLMNKVMGTLVHFSIHPELSIIDDITFKSHKYSLF